MAKQAVLLLAHGTPETVEQIPEYLRNVVSGRPMPQHVIEEIQHRYSLIGRSPLTDITLDQGRLVEAELAANGHAVPVYVGMRNWRPYIPDVVRQMRSDGIEEAAVICMAPQNSRTSVGLYKRAVQAEAGSLRFDFTESWASHPLLADAFAERLRAAEAKLKSDTGAGGSRPVYRAQRAHAHHPASAGFRSCKPASPLARRRGRSLRRRRQAHGRTGRRARSRRSRNGGSPFKARAPAEVPGLARPWKRPLIQSPAKGSKR